MGWKCTVQVTGLVRGEPKPGAKHRSNGAAICGEAGKERHSASPTLDRTRSKFNRFQGHESGAACWAEMEGKANDYRITGMNKNGKEFSRKLREDAVVGWAMIFHPPADEAADWSPERRRRFNNHCWKFMQKLEPRLFRNGNIRMIATHRDEDVEHVHMVGDAVDEDGRYCGNLIDAAMCVRINQEFPAYMRALGWDIEDVDQTDYSRMRLDENGVPVDPEYRAERLGKKAAQKGGLSVSEYAAKEARAKVAAAAKMYEDAGKALQEAQEAAQEAQRDRDEVKAMLGQTRRLIGSGEAHKAELARRQLPGQAQSDIAKRLGLT